MIPFYVGEKRKRVLGRLLGERYRSLFLLGIILILSSAASAQMDTATVSGVITDQSGGIVVGAEVRVTNSDTNITSTGTSNQSGVYLVTGLKAGRYRIKVMKDGFKGIDLTDLVLNVQDSVSRNFTLQIGSTSESVSVEGDALQINTLDGSVSTVVNRQFAENLPMNGRSFQTLIDLTPGVVLTTSSGYDSGQFSVNGQRATSNYWMVDGVSANVGIGANPTPGNGIGGTIGSFSAQGGTNSLVSVDALQEFRIQTSTYAPEFGRTPGGQISIVTRSGTNQFHGTAFDYLRNDVLDANNWFNTAVTPALPKAEERQNDFGGTFGGPILKKRTFFFFSYEGLRLRLPQTSLTTVPDLSARQSASPAQQPFLNAFPLPTVGAPDNTSTGVGQFNASYSNPASLDAYSIRIDHKLADKLNVFGRYNYSPSNITARGGGGSESLSEVDKTDITIHTATLGVTWLLTPSTSNDLRFNYSRTTAASKGSLDNFGGAVPLASVPFPSAFTVQNANFADFIFSVSPAPVQVGKFTTNLQRQFNLVDALSLQKGAHGLKFGVDFRRLSPSYGPAAYSQAVFFFDVPSAETGNFAFGSVGASRTAGLLLHNFGAFAQDTWRIRPGLTLTYGVRWDLDFAPSSYNGLNLLAVTGFNLSDLSQLALAPAGTTPFHTTYGNVAPRLGAAYQFHQSQGWQTVLRGGWGLFYDLVTSETGNLLISNGYPYGASNSIIGPAFGGTATFPFGPSDAAPPPITVANLSPSAGGTLYAFDPNIKLPYTLEWNVALEQGLGTQQTVSASYIGATGSRLIETAVISAPNPNFGTAQFVTNAGTSDYHALQIQFQRRLSRGLQALASYAWSHSIDTGSAGSAYGNAANALVPGIGANANRGASDFDVRNAFSAGVTYDIPAPRINSFANAILRGWSLQNLILAFSAPPVNVFYSSSAYATLLRSNTEVRPDVVPRIPLYLFGPQYPGGKAFNNTPGAVPGGCPDGSQSIGPFCPPPTGASGNPLRQGNLGRNALRGFGAIQWDFAVHRDFPIHESVKLQFRGEMFNVLNHPDFGPPVGNLGAPQQSNSQFGLSTQMLGQSLAGTFSTGAGSLSPLYQLGGARSIQLALKLFF